MKKLCPIPINANNESIYFLNESLNTQCIAFNTRGLEYARRMQDTNQRYEMPDDKSESAPGRMMSNEDYFDGTERVKFAFYDKSESVRKLKYAMVPYTAKHGL